MIINRRKFLQGAATTSFVGATVSSAEGSSIAVAPRLIRLTSPSSGGTACYRFACIVRHLAGVELAQLQRDWSQKTFSFRVVTARPLEEILRDMWELKDVVSLEIPRQPADLRPGEERSSSLPMFCRRTIAGRECPENKTHRSSQEGHRPKEWLVVATSGPGLTLRER